MLSEEERRDLVHFLRRALIAVLLLGLALALWRLSPLLILAFGGVLLAVVLSRLARLLAGLVPIGRKWALAVVALSMLAVVVGSGWLFGQQAVAQLQSLGVTSRQGLGRIQQMLEQLGFKDLLGDGGMLNAVVAPLSTALNAVGAVLVVVFLGLYLAAAPGPYRRGLISLFPKTRQHRVGDLLDAIGEALWRWVIGQSISMLIIAVLVTATLLLLKVPLAFPLGIIAGLLEFIPIIGPWLAAVPAVLIALTEGGQLALWVALAYFLIQQVESYMIHPIAERWAVALPPALTVASTVAFGLLFGFVGVLFATPIAVALMVVVRMLYVRDTLGEQPGDSRMPG